MLETIFNVWKKLTTTPPDPWANLPPLHINEEGWLEGEGVVCIPSHPSWYYPKLSTSTGDPIAIVAHASATKPGTGIVMAKNRTKPRTKDDRPASWHASVEVDHIVQNAPFTVGCWHAVGQIKGAGPANRVSVGIEHVGFEKGPWPEGHVMQAARLWRVLVQSYGIKRSLAMVPHAVIDPARRSDPGKPWMSQHAQSVLDYAFRP
jgi:hypothetical protein